METPEQAYRRAIRLLGGQSKAAKLLGVSPSTMHRWRICPAERAITLESLSGVERSALRPDIYPTPVSPASLAGMLSQHADKLVALAEELRAMALRSPV
jgi:DNA-binding transcriptional regulator YdaS (Cro superfamily)